jgi:hypothetical protein
MLDRQTVQSWALPERIGILLSGGNLDLDRTPWQAAS